MAGVTDRPFRRLCRSLGAGLAVSETVSANALLSGSNKTRLRIDRAREPEPRMVQIAGADPSQMADAAQFNVDRGAQIIDINMGCPAKKVCNLKAGSALLGEILAERILRAVVSAVNVPVTLKLRTGWDREHRNGLRIARIAEDSGIQTLAVHGRTRADAYRREAEYDTISDIKRTVSIPVSANGDICTPERARFVLEYTGADGIMIGRAAQGKPWIFREVHHYLQTGQKLPPPLLAERRNILLGHLRSLYEFYGEYAGVRIARKRVSWYCKGLAGSASFRNKASQVKTAAAQLALVINYFEANRTPERIAA